MKELDRQVAEIELHIQQWHRNCAASCQLAEIPGIGPITATALVASIGDAKSFENGRQVEAWLGLVPKQHSSGGRATLLGISKRGDTYLRTLLIHGAHAVIFAMQRKQRQESKVSKDNWLQRLQQRRGVNIAVVALANKNARIAWALLAHDRTYQVDYSHDGLSA